MKILTERLVNMGQIRGALSSSGLTWTCKYPSVMTLTSTLAKRPRAMNDSDDEFSPDEKSDSPKKRFKDKALLGYDTEDDLVSNFQDHADRTAEGDIIQFWQGLFQLSDAIVAIHEFSPGETNKKFQGLNPNASFHSDS
jgi:hypothetical protein